MEETKIYSLIDPRTLKVRYIGITSQPLKWRLQNHIDDCVSHPEANWHKTHWIVQLQKEGLRPIIRQLCSLPTREEAEALEAELIRKYKKSHNLINISLGNGQFTSKGQHSAQIINSKPVYVYNYKGEFIKSYPSALDCSNDLKIYYSCVIKCLAGIYKYAKQMQFSYTKVDKMPDLTNYSTGSSKEVRIKDLETNEVLTFKSGRHCSQVLGLNLVGTNIRELIPLLNKEYGNKYALWYKGEWKQSSYYNTGVKIVCADAIYHFNSKLELLKYMGASIKNCSETKLIERVNKYFTNVTKITFGLPLCQFKDKEN